MKTRHIHYGFLVVSITLSMICFCVILVKYIAGLSLTPTVMFWIFTLPPLCFYIRGEYLFQTVDDLEHLRHVYARNAAAVLLVCLLAFYTFPPLFRFLLFPEYSSSFFHYPQHAFIALGIGLLLIRLHALKGGAFLVFTGMTVNIAALFFLGTRIPEVIFGAIEIQSAGKIFEFFTIIAVFLNYFFLFTTQKNGLMKKTLVALGDIQDDVWQWLRKFLFPLLLGVAHTLFLLTLMFPTDQKMIGIIFLLLAGLWIYTGYQFRHVLFYSFAYIEIVAAIFSCRFFPAFWPETWIIWLLLALFILLIPIYSLFLTQKPGFSEKTGFFGEYQYAAESYYSWSVLTAALVLYEHVTFYGFHSNLGIFPLLAFWLTVFFVPAPLTARTQEVFKIFLGVLVYCPALFFFLQQGLPSIEFLPRAVLVVVLTSCLIIAYRLYDWQWLSETETQEPRIVHHLHWYLLQPHSLVLFFLLSTCAVFLIHILTYSLGPELFVRQVFSIVLVQGVLMVYWFDLARKDRKWWWTIIAETMLTGIIFTLRWGLPLLFELPWTVDWDLTVGLLAAFAITAARPLLKHQDKSIRTPIRFTLFGLPVMTIMYALDYDVGFDTLSRVILIYSVIFLWQAYSEKNRLVLAYAFVGMNSFLILLFFQNELQSLQAYLTPVCISILLLVQIFRDITSRTTANLVRGVTLFILLGMALFEAIVKHSTSPTAHLILISLSILTVVTAIFLRIRIFAASGIFCFIIDIIAIIYTVLSQQNVDTLKVILGIAFTVVGILILGASLLYIQHKTRIRAAIQKATATFYSWE